MSSQAPADLSPLVPADATICAGMTFPAYRHLLSLAPALRLPAEPEQRLVTAVGVVARRHGQPVGLVLAEWPVHADGGTPELLSLFVASAHRGEGIGRALLAAIEDDILVGRGASALEAVYTTGKPAIAILEHLFQRQGWSAPEPRALLVRFDMEEALAAPWVARPDRATSLLPDGATIFPWVELSGAERQHLRDSNTARPWIPNSLQPWRHDHLGFDPVSSVGLRYRGEVVGWVINHQVDDRTVRFTCSFMRKDLSRRARIVPLYVEAIRRLAGTACRHCTLITPAVYPGMTTFILRHIAPHGGFVGETRGTRKSAATPGGAGAGPAPVRS